jgi:hypothetical protein
VTNRATLCGYFGEGELPTPKHFRELIEAMLHMEEEGFSKSNDFGLEITSAVGRPELLSFFRGGAIREAQWTVALGADRRLIFTPGGQTSMALLALDAHQPDDPREAVVPRVGIGLANPLHELHVAGAVGSVGRRGTRPLPAEESKKPRIANGDWHALTEVLDGCVALEVVVRATSPGTDRHAVLHAVALNAYNPVLGDWLGTWLGGWIDRHFNRRKRIRAQCAWRSRRCDRLELAWHTAEKGPDNPSGLGYRLMVRSMCDYGMPVPIEAHITELWSPLAARRDA